MLELTVDNINKYYERIPETKNGSCACCPFESFNSIPQFNKLGAEICYYLLEQSVSCGGTIYKERVPHNLLDTLTQHSQSVVDVLKRVSVIMDEGTKPSEKIEKFESLVNNKRLLQPCLDVLNVFSELESAKEPPFPVLIHNIDTGEEYIACSVFECKNEVDRSGYSSVVKDNCSITIGKTAYGFATIFDIMSCRFRELLPGDVVKSDVTGFYYVKLEDEQPFVANVHTGEKLHYSKIGVFTLSSLMEAANAQG